MKKNDFQQIKSSVRIEEVIGGYQHLEPKGKNYVGLCPFHPDHHPSLMVNPEKQTYSCFACGGTWGCIRVCQEDGTLYVE